MNNNFDKFDTFLINNELHKSNRIKQQELQEKQEMRKAYCKVNNIPYVETEEVYNNPKILEWLVVMVWITIFISGSWLFMMGGDNFLRFIKSFL